LQVVAGDYQLDLISRDNKRDPNAYLYILEQFETKQLNEEGVPWHTNFVSVT
jgi:hypothetical protein